MPNHIFIELTKYIVNLKNSTFIVTFAYLDEKRGYKLINIAYR